jgi:hypothetical protein
MEEKDGNMNKRFSKEIEILKNKDKNKNGGNENNESNKNR